MSKSKSFFSKKNIIILLFISFTIIFGFLSSNSNQMISFFGANKKALSILHVASMAFGLVCASLCDLFFFKFLRDYKISVFEKSILDFLSNIMWIALFVASLSGIALFLPNAERLLQSSKFLLKTIVIVIITVNGFLLTSIISPQLRKFNFKNTTNEKNDSSKLRKLGFILGAISIVSWWSAFILGSFRSLPWSFTELTTAYFVVLICAISISLLVEKRIIN